MISSTNGGTSWSTPVKVNQGLLQMEKKLILHGLPVILKQVHWQLFFMMTAILQVLHAKHGWPIQLMLVVHGPTSG